MASYNRVILIGNVTRDLELRYTPQGQAVMDIGLAVNRTYKTAAAETREETAFVDIVVWGRQAETCHQYLSKGSPLFVEGRLQYETWDDRATGQKRSRLRVVAERTQFLGRPRAAEYQDVAGGPPEEAPAAEPGAGRRSAPAQAAPTAPPPPPPPAAVGPEDILNDEEDNIPF